MVLPDFPRRGSSGGEDRNVNKRKNATALFEVIAKSKQKPADIAMRVPDKSPRPEEGAAPAPERTEPPAAPPAAPRPEPSRPRPAPTPRPAVALESVLSTTGGRLRLSLNYVSASVAGAAVVLLLVLAFTVGRSAREQGPQQQEQAGLPSPGAAQPHDKAASQIVAPPAKPARVEGKYYLVIESLQGNADRHKTEAFRIADFCTQMGEPADVQLWRSQYIVWSLTPFNSPSDSAAMKHADTVEKLGDNYFRKYRTYKFKQRDSSGQLRPLFLPYRTQPARG